MTCEKMKEIFENDGWNNVNFTEVTKEEAEEKGLLFAVLGIEKGKKYFQNIGANGTHIYHGSLKTNEDISTAISNMLDLVIVAHIPSRFHVDRSAFDTLNKHLDYLNIIQSI